MGCIITSLLKLVNLDWKISINSMKFTSNLKKNECNKKPHTLNQNEKYLLTIEKS